MSEDVMPITDPAVSGQKKKSSGSMGRPWVLWHGGTEQSLGLCTCRRLRFRLRSFHVPR